MSEVARQPILADLAEEFPAYQAPYTPALKIVAEHDNLESIIAGVEAGRGVAVLYQSLGRIACKRAVLRPLKPRAPASADCDRLPQRTRFSHCRCVCGGCEKQQN